MLMLLMHLGGDQYALRSSEIVEIVPRVALRAVPQAPPEVAGLMNFRGDIVVVIDLSRLVLGVPCNDSLSTRIVVVEYVNVAGRVRRLGLLAERVTEMINRNEEDFTTSALNLEKTPFLGGVSVDNRGMLQYLMVEKLVADSLLHTLLPAEMPGQRDTASGEER
ncbi:MAG TPA: chemotaxis protein CheW [Thermoanaerobaculia bacterium]|nr:chemotaxis protein CheW [Thermoanaerobaculia bacterium]